MRKLIKSYFNANQKDNENSDITKKYINYFIIHNQEYINNQIEYYKSQNTETFKYSNTFNRNTKNYYK